MRHSFDPTRFKRVVGQFAPRALAFNGKKAASVYLARPTKLIEYGRQAERIGSVLLPSSPADAPLSETAAGGAAIPFASGYQ
jgi:hypothetical protein